MTRGLDVLTERTKGQFPVSIATSLAIEGSLGIIADKPAPDIPPMNETDEVWINLRTLFRNMVGSVDAKNEHLIKAVEYASIIEEEVKILRNTISDKTQGRVNTFFYACDYKSIDKLLPFAVFKGITTDKQKHYAFNENHAIEEFGKRVKGTELDFYHFDTKLRGHNKKVLMVTHYPLDLIYNQEFAEVVLLESHTGVAKKKSMWYTKLTNGKELANVPFNLATLQLFGDNGGLFLSQPNDLRNEFVRIATKHKWHPLTTRERILLGLSIEKVPVLEGLVKKLFIFT